MYIRIIGAGVMGRGIAQWAAVAGNTVELADARPEPVREACTFIEDMLDRAVAKQRMTPETAAAACARLIPLPTFDAPGDQVELVIEAIHEDLQSKIDLFRRLEQVLPPTAVFSTNTSSLSVTRIAAGLANPQRLIGLHFFNPAPLMKIVEVIPGVHTRPGIAPKLVEFVSRCGHRRRLITPRVGDWGRVACRRATPLTEQSRGDAGRRRSGLGRSNRPVPTWGTTVAAAVAERSIATPTDIDDAVAAGLGYPHGPLAWGDRIGAAQLLDLQQSLHQNTGDQRYRPARWVTERAQLGLPLIHQRKEIAS